MQSEDLLCKARAYASKADYPAMRHCCETIITQATSDASTLLPVAELYASNGFLTDADNLLAQFPNDVRALSGRLAILRQAGEHQKARRLYKTIAARLPEMPPFMRHAWLTSLEYDPEADTAFRLREAKAWGKWAVAVTGGPRQRPAAKARNGRPLRVGYVSCDFHHHTVGLLALPVFRNHRCDVFAYYGGREEDKITHEIHKITQFRSIQDLSMKDAAKIMRNDELDILVDLSGHCGRSSLLAFAFRPAPVLVSWLGSFFTTGLPYMDAFLTDRWQGDQTQFTEPLLCLDHGRLCYEPLPFAPEVACMDTQRPITFGSFNDTAKYNPRVFALWAKILQAVPGSRLILKWATFHDNAYTSHVRSVFALHGVDPQRLVLRGQSTHCDMLAQYADVHIALDPFPFSGCQTSLEALWMGVPVVSLPGTRMVSRQTHAILHQIGLPELSAADEEDYVRIAVQLSRNTEKLQSLRSSLRETMKQAPLMDSRGFAQELEDVYRELLDKVTWHAHTAQARADDTPLPQQLRRRYLDLLKASLLNEIYLENEVRLLYMAMAGVTRQPFDSKAITDPRTYLPDLCAYVDKQKHNGEPFYFIRDKNTGTLADVRNLCDVAYSMIGRRRMDSLEACLDIIRQENIAGDLLEAGVCRGGACIFMRGYLEAWGMPDKLVYCADSFEGLPVPSCDEDKNADLSKKKYPILAISEEQVRENFRRYNLLDERVLFLKGWFCDSLPKADIAQLALLRLDADLYESTRDALNALGHKVVPGGFVIVDDYYTFQQCRQAVDEWRTAHGVTSKLESIDNQSVFWRA